jgi:hypothetical protein
MTEFQRHQNYAGQYQVFGVACSSAIEPYLRASQQESKTRSKTTTPFCLIAIEHRLSFAK